VICPDRTTPSDDDDRSARERGDFVETHRPTWVRIDARCRRAWLAGAVVAAIWVALVFVPLLIVRLSQSTFGQSELGLSGPDLEAVLGIALVTLRAAAFGSAVAIAIWFDLLARSIPVWGAFGPQVIERSALGAWWRWLERALPAPSVAVGVLLLPALLRLAVPFRITGSGAAPSVSITASIVYLLVALLTTLSACSVYRAGTMVHDGRRASIARHAWVPLGLWSGALIALALSVDAFRDRLPLVAVALSVLIWLLAFARLHRMIRRAIRAA
jgi:hypothetical protein